METTTIIKNADKSFYGPIEIYKFKREIEERKEMYNLLDYERMKLLQQIK